MKRLKVKGKKEFQGSKLSQYELFFVRGGDGDETGNGNTVSPPPPPPPDPPDSPTGG